MELYKKDNIYEVYPEYWIIKVSQFHNRIKDKLEEWIYFFKNAEIKDGSTAKGLKEVNERLDEMKLNEKDAKVYKRYLKNLRDIASDQHTKMVDAQDLIKKGEEKKEIELIFEMDKEGFTVPQIARVTKKDEEYIRQILDNRLMFLNY